MKQRRAVTTSLAATLLCVALLLTLAPPASADHGNDWYVGAGFRIGGIFFNIVLGGRGYDRPHYYYRTRDRLDYPGYRCTSACFRQDRYSYHAPNCPVAGHHLDRYHQDPYEVFDRYAPYYGDRDDYGYRDRYDGRRDDGRYYDDRRYDDRRYDGRYYDRHRGTWRDRHHRRPHRPPHH